MQNYYIGVDGGGSKTHVIIVDKNQQLIAETTSGAANIRSNLNLAYKSITSSINTLLQQTKTAANQVKIGVGVAGYSLPEQRKQLLQQLQAEFPFVKLESDCHIACLAAHNNRPGSVVICGTGVSGYTIDRNLDTHQTGGWGFPHGDLGGGAWIGLQLCSLLCKAIDNIIPWSSVLRKVYANFNSEPLKFKTWVVNATISDFVSLAKMVTMQPLHKDTHAENIIHQGSLHLGDLIAATILQHPNYPIKLVGGLAPVYMPLIKLKFPMVELSTTDPAIGAYLLWQEFDNIN